MRVTEFKGLSRCQRDLLLGTCVTWGVILVAMIVVIYFALTRDARNGAEAAAHVAESQAVVADSDDQS